MEPRWLVPSHLLQLDADPNVQIVWLSSLPGGLQLRYLVAEEKWLADAGGRGAWGHAFPQALEHLLLELSAPEVNS